MEEDNRGDPLNRVDPYNLPESSGPGWGGATALLVVLVLLGGLIAYSTLSTPPADAPAPAADPAPTQTMPSGGAMPGG